MLTNAKIWSDFHRLIKLYRAYGVTLVGAAISPELMSALKEMGARFETIECAKGINFYMGLEFIEDPDVKGFEFFSDSVAFMIRKRDLNYEWKSDIK